MLTISPIKQKSAQYLAQAKAVFLTVFVPGEDNCFLPKALKPKYLFWYGAGLLIVKIALISLVLFLPSADFFSAIAANHLMALVNQERQARNLSALSLNDSLNFVSNNGGSDTLRKDNNRFFRKHAYSSTYAPSRRRTHKMHVAVSMDRHLVVCR